MGGTVNFVVWVVFILPILIHSGNRRSPNQELACRHNTLSKLLNDYKEGGGV